MTSSVLTVMNPEQRTGTSIDTKATTETETNKTHALTTKRADRTSSALKETTITSEIRETSVTLDHLLNRTKTLCILITTTTTEQETTTTIHSTSTLNQKIKLIKDSIDYLHYDKLTIIINTQITSHRQKVISCISEYSVGIYTTTSSSLPSSSFTAMSIFILKNHLTLNLFIAFIKVGVSSWLHAPRKGRRTFIKSHYSQQPSKT